MPVNKNAFRRFQIIDEMLKRKRYPSRMDILDRLDQEGYTVSGATFENDLATLRLEFDLPIAYSHAEKGYYYTDPDVAFDLPIGNEEIETIWMAIDTLRQFRHSEAFKNVNKSLERIMTRLKIDLVKKQESADKIIYYEPEPDFAGSEWLSVIYDAIREERRISFTFNAFGEKTDHLMEPYALKEFVGRWYVIGVDKLVIAIYGLDRIEGLSSVNSYFQKNKKTAARIHGEINMSMGILDFKARKHIAEIAYDASLAEEIKLNPFLSNMQIRKEDSKEIIIYLWAKIDADFVRRAILPYGDKVRVLGPPFYVDLVIRTLTKMLDLHKDIIMNVSASKEKLNA